MVEVFQQAGFKVVSGGTDNHLFTVDVKAKTGINGKDAEKILDNVHITVNKNTVPFDPEPPFITSGIRIGTPAITTRGFGVKESQQVATLIIKALEQAKDVDAQRDVQESIAELTNAFSLPA